MTKLERNLEITWPSPSLNVDIQEPQRRGMTCSKSHSKVMAGTELELEKAFVVVVVLTITNRYRNYARISQHGEYTV